jgi:hypothetical protein
VFGKRANEKIVHARIATLDLGKRILIRRREAS